MSDLFDNLKQQLNLTETELLKALTQALSTQTTKSSSDEGSTPSPTPSEPITSNDEDDGDESERTVVQYDDPLDGVVYKGMVVAVPQKGLKQWSHDLGVELNMPLILRSSDDNAFSVICTHGLRHKSNSKDGSRPNQSRMYNGCKFEIRGYKGEFLFIGFVL